MNLDFFHVPISGNVLHAIIMKRRFAGSKAQEVGRWAPAATRFIAYSPNFPFHFSSLTLVILGMSSWFPEIHYNETWQYNKY